MDWSDPVRGPNFRSEILFGLDLYLVRILVLYVVQILAQYVVRNPLKVDNKYELLVPD